ncbi:MAG TPA: ABC transporter permease [Gemmatimonadaceae bacterium]|nr:ABC transporter permease [Gemmatimonadaceae bacterium]
MTIIDPVRLLAIARKEWIQVRRDRRSLYLAFGLPLLLLIFFGYAINWDIEDLPLAVLDRDHTAESRALVDAFTASGLFTVVDRPAREAEVEAGLVSGAVRAALVVPPGFARDAAAGDARVQLLLDGADANTATVALGYADAIVARYGARLAGSRTSAPPIDPQARVWYNPTLESKNMIVPALIAVIMSVIAALLTALTIAREWERGTMEQLAASPVSRVEVVLGKLLPYLAIGLVDVAAAVAAGLLVFQAPLRGDVFLLGVLTILFLAGALGFGIFISAAVKSQVLATQMGLIATYLPSLLLSGFLFDIASMPLPLQGVTLLVPARYFVTVTRGIFLKGVGLEALWPQALMMIAFATLGLALAVRAFKKEIPA